MAEAFFPGVTVPVAATTSSASASLASGAAPMQVRMFNSGSTTAFVKFGPTGLTAATTDYPLPANAIEVITIPASATTTFAAAIYGTGSGTVYFTPGAGI